MFYSPLRYPGGKGKLAHFMELMIKELSIKNCTYIEPFAGGAAIALYLLLNDIVSEIIINDYDKAIAAFWNAITKHTEKFINKMYNTPVTIDEWKKQKQIYTNGTSCNDFNLGFATFFLNRTNRSGIIQGGAIGGLLQNGDWKIDARFNKNDLEKRIRRIAEHKNSIKIYNKDVKSLIVNILPKYSNDSFVYFDPPYFNKGKQLYKNYFEINHHKQIEKYISQYVKCNWIMTYDNVPEILNIYKTYQIKTFNLNYSAGKAKIGSEILILPNNIDFQLLNKLNKQINVQ